MLYQDLEKIGLSEKEAKVYLAALELGQAPVQDISKKSGVNRATTYVILESLMKKGIITTTEQGKKRLFVAEAPQTLKHVIDEQKEELKKREGQLKEMMTKLESVYNLHPNKPVVRFYEGKEGLKTILEERLIDKPKEVRVFFPGELVDLFTPEEKEDYRKKRKKHNTHYVGIVSMENPAADFNYSGDLLKVSSKDYPFESDIAVYDNKVSFSNVRGTVGGVVIENKAIAETIRSIFKLVSNCLKK